LRGPDLGRTGLDCTGSAEIHAWLDSGAGKDEATGPGRPCACAIVISSGHGSPPDGLPYCEAGLFEEWEAPGLWRVCGLRRGGHVWIVRAASFEGWLAYYWRPWGCPLFPDDVDGPG
jgi:hypothetical protein